MCVCAHVCVYWVPFASSMFFYYEVLILRFNLSCHVDFWTDPYADFLTKTHTSRCINTKLMFIFMNVCAIFGRCVILKLVYTGIILLELNVSMFMCINELLVY